MPRRSKLLIAGSVSAETWANVCLQLDSNPRKVLMTICAIRGLSWWLDDAWWATFLKRVQTNLQRRGWEPHWFMRAAAFPNIRPPQCRQLIRLVYGMFCEMCGCRFHHRIHNGLMKRLCTECRHDNYVSNTVLYFEYGLSMEDILNPYFHFVRSSRLCEYIKASDYHTYTRHPLDVGGLPKKQLVFFWKPDLARLFDLSALAIAQRRRVAAVDSIKARLRMAYARNAVMRPPGHKGGHGSGPVQWPRYYLETLHSNEVKRIREPLFNPHWIAGGPSPQGYRLSSAREELTNAVINTRKRFLSRLTLYTTMPLLGDREYTLKTAMERLRLDRATLRDRADLWDEAARSSDRTTSNHVFQLVEEEGAAETVEA